MYNYSPRYFISLMPSFVKKSLPRTKPIFCTLLLLSRSDAIKVVILKREIPLYLYNYAWLCLIPPDCPTSSINAEMKSVIALFINSMWYRARLRFNIPLLICLLRERIRNTTIYPAVISQRYWISSRLWFNQCDKIQHDYCDIFLILPSF